MEKPIMKTSILAFTGLLVPACAGDPAPEPEPTATAAVQAACYGDRCAEAGEFDFHLSGTQVSAWEGRRVMAAAVENGNGPTGDHRVVLLSSVIRNGQFSLFCPSSLSENYHYPSYAVFVDVNGDGRCSSGDVGYNAQLFGWNWDVDEVVTPDWFMPVTNVAGPIGGSSSDFCSGYFR